MHISLKLRSAKIKLVKKLCHFKPTLSQEKIGELWTGAVPGLLTNLTVW
ncbi:hypothetical protein N481_18735 [Pseudoalteromonas luteoviolacea S4047-1]|uniref:Uncharacterized protein n=1 Tax=Pseudoalteromonas luteoviolacea S4054 TaxID=1129367 RepID=A0A0F6A6E2_9GAMM|nr:hypothetical protein N479_02640 [Pseudoalteromonas luteoviolacea S4054]KZN71706.1 hypothetical protein N481_18735 [Pseudoalteromonas luteoviolacea S4047-1]